MSAYLLTLVDGPAAGAAWAPADVPDVTGALVDVDLRGGA